MGWDGMGRSSDEIDDGVRWDGKEEVVLGEKGRWGVEMLKCCDLVFGDGG